jgi:hypothetical protein
MHILEVVMNGLFRVSLWLQMRLVVTGSVEVCPWLTKLLSLGQMVMNLTQVGYGLFVKYQANV